MKKICDECHEETGFYTVQKHGTVLCYDCTKREKSGDKQPSVVRTNDPFIRMCRRLSGASKEFPFDEVIADMPEGRSYTNGHVLLSDVDDTPSIVDGFDLNTLKPKRSAYPSVKRVIDRTGDGKVVDIPEDFYGYLNAAFDSKRRGYAFVKIHEGGLTVVEREGPNVVMNYREVVPPINFEITLDAVYMREMKPGKLRVSGSNVAAVVEASYEPHVDAFKHVIIMPRVDIDEGGTE